MPVRPEGGIVKLPCSFCAIEVDDRATGAMLEVTGWAENRTGGGAHGITDRRNTGRVAHKACLDAALRGYRPESML